MIHVLLSSAVFDVEEAATKTKRGKEALSKG